MPEEPVARFMGGGAGDCKVTFHADDYIGEGASRGLSRGILVFTGGKNLTGEGMGIGSIAFRKGGCTYFPSTCLTRSSDNTITEKVFFVDTWRKWARKGRPSRYLTRFIELTADCYMALPWFQPILCVQSPLIHAFSLHPHLEQISPLARSEFRYTCDREAILVSCKITSYCDDLPRMFILNELDGDIFSRSVIQGLPLPPPSGWRPYPGDAALSSEKLGICFWPADTTVSGGSWRLFWGRERNSSLRWAGFILMIDPLPENKSIECSYVVRFGKNVGSEA